MRTLYGVAGGILLCDQLTKFLAVRFLKPDTSIPIIPHVFHLSFVENTGIAFGFFQGHPEFWTLIITVSVFCLALCSRFFLNRPLSYKLAYGLILGGAVGNWMDRIRFEHVIDFLDFFVWPLF